MGSGRDSVRAPHGPKPFHQPKDLRPNGRELFPCFHSFCELCASVTVCICAAVQVTSVCHHISIGREGLRPISGSEKSCDKQLLVVVLSPIPAVI